MQTQTSTIAEARELHAFGLRCLEALHAGEQRLPRGPDFEEERGWLASAARRVEREAQGLSAALAGAIALPEFEAERQARAKELFESWIDAVEGLAVGISSRLSPQSPLLEVLFQHQKFDKLRRGGNAARAYLTDLERRRRTAYVVRLSGEPEYDVLPPLLARLDAAKLAFEEQEQPPALAEDELAALRHGVLAAADGLRAVLHQARLLADAALSAHPGWFAELGLDAKPRSKRSARPAADAEPT
ncbi:MAG TPA: hypothetical protein VMG12_40855 [Polyangiaceae bacterium]|nr:hypothetical protein [Polyangiaceae bacterium]